MNTTSWSPNGTPFCWMPKEALRLIEQNLEQPASATLLYLALCRVACNENTGTFTKPLAYIASLASIERRTVERRLPDLERLKLVSVKRGTLRIPHTFTLATLSRNDTSESRSVATLNRPQRVALSRDIETKRRKPRTTAERIGIENQIRILRDRLKVLKDDTSEAWQRQEHPELVQQRDSVADEIAKLEDSLL